MLKEVFSGGKIIIDEHFKKKLSREKKIFLMSKGVFKSVEAQNLF
jgi:hypothetical protein